MDYEFILSQLLLYYSQIRELLANGRDGLQKHEGLMKVSFYMWRHVWLFNLWLYASMVYAVGVSSSVTASLPSLTSRIISSGGIVVFWCSFFDAKYLVEIPVGSTEIGTPNPRYNHLCSVKLWWWWVKEFYGKLFWVLKFILNKIIIHLRTESEMKLKLICPQVNNNWNRNFFSEAKLTC